MSCRETSRPGMRPIAPRRETIEIDYRGEIHQWAKSIRRGHNMSRNRSEFPSSAFYGSPSMSTNRNITSQGNPPGQPGFPTFHKATTTVARDPTMMLFLRPGRPSIIRLPRRPSLSANHQARRVNSTAPAGPMPKRSCSIRGARPRGGCHRPGRFKRLGRRLLDRRVLFDVLPDDLATTERLSGYRKVIAYTDGEAADLDGPDFSRSQPPRRSASRRAGPPSMASWTSISSTTIAPSPP